ncbi:MAG: GtrA family protein [Candidatus Cloacimonetes bacterium]|nr:GtrA family protein [Candidatus Cloacimonadota bacterium]MDD4232065.1 GtrA family protein [Candidatus Cloacimonadota bacterium]
MWNSKQYLSQFIRFLASGLPSFLIAIPLNVFLVQVLGIHKVWAYCLVLLFQITLNFFVLKRFTFMESEGSALRKFGLFMPGIILFRILDAGLYALLVQVWGVYYILAQLINVVIFSMAKFIFSKYVFERAK